MCTEISKKKKNFTSFNRSSNNKSFGVQEKKPCEIKQMDIHLKRAQGGIICYTFYQDEGKTDGT